MSKRAGMFLLTAVMLLSSLVTAAPVHADAPEEQIGVALFIKTDRYHAPASTVTLSAEGGLAFSDEQGQPWLRTADGQTTRASVDGYRVLVTETGEGGKAEAMHLELKKAQQPSSVFTYTVKGTQMHRVYAGPYENKAQADLARNALAGNTAITGRLAGAQMAVTGPFYASIGGYPSEAEALKAAVPLWNAGIYAVPAITLSESGSPVYSLWLGESPDAAALQQAVTRASAAVQGLAPKAVAAATRYVLLRSDRSGDTGLVNAVRHISFSGDGPRLTAVPNSAAAAIRVAERFNRSYRGTIELSRHNGSLAVINRVGLETYVSSVVGSELDASWPQEVLKAQAVAARTFVLKQGLKYGIAHVTDTTFDQAYRGVEREFPVIAAAVQATAGERLRGADGVLLDAFYHSNSGNMTAEPLEVWNTPVAGMRSVPSPDDLAEKGKLMWYRIVLPDQRIGYVRSDLVRLTGAVNPAGFPKAVTTEGGVNIREAPFVNNDTNPAISQLANGAAVTIIGRDIESTSYRWIRGPISGYRMQLSMAASGVSAPAVGQIGQLLQLSVSQRSSTTGRVTQLAVNGNVLQVTRPEDNRTLLGLPSTRFNIEETAKVTLLGSGARSAELPSSAGAAAITALGAGGIKQTISSDAFLVSDGGEEARVVTREPGFRFHGFGFGHGVGMSQWGAYGLAELGYDYRKILQYYYKDASVTRE